MSSFTYEMIERAVQAGCSVRLAMLQLRYAMERLTDGDSSLRKELERVMFSLSLADEDLTPPVPDIDIPEQKEKTE